MKIKYECNLKETLKKIRLTDSLAFLCVKCGVETEKQKRNFKKNPELLCKKCLTKKNSKKRDKSFYQEMASKRTKTSFTKASSTRKNNNLKRYGVENISQLQETKDKIKKNNLKRYGVENTSQLQETKDKIKKTLLSDSYNNFSKYGFTPLFDINKWDGKFIREKRNWECNKCETVFEDTIHGNKGTPRCPKCNPILKGTSYGEQELLEFTQGKKYRDHIEIDALVDNIGFEFNGLYWHSEKFKDPNYHIEKTNYFKEKGIDVYHIFEDEWNDKKEIVKSIINSKLNRLQTTIYGRKCKIKEVSKKVSRVFQDENHIQGFVGSKVSIGLYYENSLVSLMTFGKSRFNQEVEWELLRFVNRKNTRVLGGASKCFKHFIKTYNPKSILSYSDTRLFGGEMYEKLGFKFTHSTTPNYYYMKNGRRYNRMKFQKHKLKDLFEDFDADKTERQMMAENNFLRIYDCGMKVWILNF